MRTFRKMTLAALLAASISAPLAAQGYSEGFEFLKAVRDRDGQAVTDALSAPGSTIVNTRNLGNGETALHIVTQRRDLAWIRFLTSKGANPNVADKNGLTPLILASDLGFVEGVEVLLKAGAQVDDTNQAGETPLISAVHRRDTAMVRLLLENGANPDRNDNSGRSARDYAELVGSNAILAEFRNADGRQSAQTKTYGPSL